MTNRETQRRAKQAERAAAVLRLYFGDDSARATDLLQIAAELRGNGRFTTGEAWNIVHQPSAYLPMDVAAARRQLGLEPDVS